MTRGQSKGGMRPWGKLLESFPRPGQLNGSCGQTRGQGPTLRAQQEALVLARGTTPQGLPQPGWSQRSACPRLPVYRPLSLPGMSGDDSND